MIYIPMMNKVPAAPGIPAIISMPLDEDVDEEVGEGAMVSTENKY